MKESEKGVKRKKKEKKKIKEGEESLFHLPPKPQKPVPGGRLAQKFVMRHLVKTQLYTLYSCVAAVPLSLSRLCRAEI